MMNKRESKIYVTRLTVKVHERGLIKITGSSIRIQYSELDVIYIREKILIQRVVRETFSGEIEIRILRIREGSYREIVELYDNKLKRLINFNSGTRFKKVMAGIFLDYCGENVRKWRIEDIR